jgi:hypothetical protein
LQELETSGERLTLAPELLELDDVAVLARDDADPDRRRCRPIASDCWSFWRHSTRSCARAWAEGLLHVVDVTEMKRLIPHPLGCVSGRCRYPSTHC